MIGDALLTTPIDHCNWAEAQAGGTGRTTGGLTSSARDCYLLMQVDVCGQKELGRRLCRRLFGVFLRLVLD